MFNKKIKSRLSKVLALGMVATSASMAAQQITASADQVENTNSTYTRTTTKIGTVTATALTVRNGAGTSYQAVGYLSKNAQVTVLETESNGWHKIKTATGLVGYVSPKYLKVTTTTTNDNNDSNDSNNTNTGVYVVQSYSTISKVGTVTASSLNVRTGPATSYSKKTAITKGALVGILKQYNNGWYEVKLKNGTTGCVSGSYLTIKAGTEADLSNGSTSSETTTGTTNNAKVNAVIALAKKQLGKPYVYGAAGPSSFDCSGLTYYCYKNAAGITLNRSSAAQASNGKYVAKSQLKPGDLVFFNSGTNRIRHVGLYVGNGQMIHSPSTGKDVRYQSINTNYYIKGYMTARRVIG